MSDDLDKERLHPEGAPGIAAVFSRLLMGDATYEADMAARAQAAADTAEHIASLRHNELDEARARVWHARMQVLLVAVLVVFVAAMTVLVIKEW